MATHPHHRSDLQRLARRSLAERGLWSDFDPAGLRQLANLRGPASELSDGVRDLRDLPWCSIDNDDSMDLDQLTAAVGVGEGETRVLVAIADVDALVPRGTPLDSHAGHNTASIYVAGHVYPMLPEQLSTDWTSLGPGVDRLALIVELVVDQAGQLVGSDVFRGMVRNQAKLTYHGVGAWFEGQGPLPEAASRLPGMDVQLQLQDAVARRLRHLRHERGALDLAKVEARPVFQGDAVVGLRVENPNRAKWLVEELMIAANGVVARFLEAKQRPSLRRVVKSPERWERIVEVAGKLGERLPSQASARALEAFLLKRRLADPLHFPDLSLVIVKLMGPGEYVAEAPGCAHTGHFGLSVKDYAHATAPNRRFPDLVTQRLLKAAMANVPSPYGLAELSVIARHCTLQEGSIAKVERQIHKSAAVLLLERRVGESFDAVVTGAATKGTWVRIFEPPVEGRLVHAMAGLHVGDKLRVRLIATDFERGFLDFSQAQ
jgi:exoribonuclease-2